MPHPTRQAIIKWAAAVLFALVIYPLSNAPVASIMRSVGSSGELRVFKPVDWMIDETAARTPLLVWARVWGVEDEFETASQIRRFGMDAI